MFLSGVCSGPTTTENVWVTGWQSQVAPSGDRRRHFRHRSLAGDRCYGSNNTGWNSTEQKAGGQGSPVMLAAGAATCSLPPTAKASEQTAALAPALRSSLHGSCAVQVRRATMLAVLRHSAYTANAQFSENSIISSLKWIILGKIAKFFWLGIMVFCSADGKVQGQVWKAFDILTGFVPGNFAKWNLKILNICLEFWDGQQPCWMQNHAPLLATPCMCTYFCPKNCA